MTARTPKGESHRSTGGRKPPVRATAASPGSTTEGAQLAAVLDMLPVYLVLLSPDYHVPFANRFFRERFGEANGRRCFEYLFNRTEPCEVCETYKALKEMRPLEWRWTGPDGRRYHIFDYPFRDAGGAAQIMEVGIDITEHELAQEELRQARDSLEQRVAERTSALSEAEATARKVADEWKTTFDSIADMVSIQDKDFRLVRVNKAYEDAVGVKAADLVGRHCYEVVHGTACPVDDCPHRQTVADGRSNTKEIFEPRLGVHLEVSTSPVVDDKGQVVASVHIAKNITERKEVEESLLASEKRYRSFIEVTGELGWVTDPDGQVVEDIPAFRQYTGQTYDEAKGSGWTAALHPDDLERTREVWSTAVREKVRYEVEYRLRRYDGVYRDFLARGVPVLSEDGSVREWVGTCIDITERKRMEEQLRLRADELEAANKELETLAYSVSHDLQAPLRSLDGFSEALLEDYGEALDATAKDYLGRIRGSSQTMGQLIDSLLRLSRVTRTELHRETVDLSEMAADIAARLKSSQPERTADFVIAAGLIGTGDRYLLRQVLENLLGNAWKFSAGRQPARIELGSVYREGQPAYFVRDNGVGFNMAYANKLFQPFQRLHSSSEFPGTGIGLATVQRIIHRHGGEVWAESEVDKGATVYFTLR